MPKELPTVYVTLAPGQEVVISTNRPTRVVSSNKDRTRRRLRADGTYVEPTSASGLLLALDAHT